MKNYISININYIRKKNLMSQSEMSEKYGLSNTVIGSYERGRSQPSIEFIQKFCADYIINIDDFFNKDLSKLDNTENYVREIPANYGDSLEAKFYERIISAKDETIKIKDEVILQQNKVIETQNKTLKSLEKQSGVYEVLLNQNSILDKG